MADRDRWTAPRRWIADNWPDIVSVAGAIAVVRGVALWSAAAAWVTAGVLAIAAAMLAAGSGTALLALLVRSATRRNA